MIKDVNKDIIISIIAGSILFFLLCTFIVAFIILYRKKRRQHNLERKKISSEFSKILLQSQLEIKEQTLQNIAYELHDNIGHTAILIKIFLHTINLDNKDEAKNKILESKELMKQLIKDLKLLSLDLNSDRAIQIGLPKILEIEIDKLNLTNALKARFSLIGNEFILSSNTTVILYRMSQEIINNILKHSQATEVSLEITFLENLLTLVFYDNGLGFDVSKKNGGSGNGLINMQNRATVINAKLSIESTLGNGTSITILIPK